MCLLGYDVGQKGYRCFDSVSQILYVSRNVVLLEHIPFFSIPASSHYLTTYGVIKIDPLDIDDTTPTSVPTPDHVLAPIIDTALEFVLIDSPTMLVQSSFELVVPLPLVRPNHNHKSAQPPDFVYSSYSSLFVVLLSLFIVFMSLHHI